MQGDTELRESAGSTGEIKRRVFPAYAMGLEFWLRSFWSWVHNQKKNKKLASQASCFSDSVVWSVVLYGFVCAVFFAFSEVKTAHFFWAMFLFIKWFSPLSTATTV